MKRIDFSNNWNNKLHCHAFTTIRLSDGYNIGDKVEIFLKEIKVGIVEVIGKQPLLLSDLLKKEYLCYLDTGYSAQETYNIIKTMYKNKITDNSTIYVYLLKKIKA